MANWIIFTAIIDSQIHNCYYLSIELHSCKDFDRRPFFFIPYGIQCQAIFWFGHLIFHKEICSIDKGFSGRPNKKPRQSNTEYWKEIRPAFHTSHNTKLKNAVPFLAYLAKGHVSYCHHLASVVFVVCRRCH